MSVIACQEIWNGRAGGIDEKGVRNFTRVFLVEVDALSDGAYVATSASCIPALYAHYVTAERTDNGAIVKNIEAKPRSDNPYLWEITVKYDSGPLRRMESPADSNDNRTAPDSRPWTFSFSANKSTRILTQDWQSFNTGGGSPNRPCVNSAGQPLTPPLEMPAANPVIKITAFKSSFSFDKITHFQDAVNSAPFTLGGIVFAANTVRCVDYGAQSHFDNNVFCFQIDVQLEVKQDGWTPTSVQDSGTYAIFSVGGVPTLKAITDAYGQPIHSPVPLDGMGHVLTPGSAVVYLEFDTFRLVDFSALI